AEARAIYPELRDDLGRIAAGWYCAELIDRFTVERVPSAPLFDLLETALRHLDAGNAGSLVCRWFDLHLLDRSGFRPELADCVSCRKPLEERENAWNAASGGATCDACAHRTQTGMSLSVRALKSLRYLLVSDFANAARLRVDTVLASELERHMRLLVQHFIDPLVECGNCRKRFRIDELSDGDALMDQWRDGRADLSTVACPNCGQKKLGPPRRFNLMFKTFVGPVEDTASVAWLRPE